MRNSAVQTIANDLGKILRMDVAVMADLAYVENAGVEHEGVNDLENGGGKIASGAFCLLTAAEIRARNVALENIDVTLAAVENDLFLNYGNTVGFLRSAETSADLHGDLDIEGDTDLVKATVERYVINVDVCAQDLRAFGADCGSALQ